MTKKGTTRRTTHIKISNDWRGTRGGKVDNQDTQFVECIIALNSPLADMSFDASLWNKRAATLTGQWESGPVTEFAFSVQAEAGRSRSCV